MKADYEIRQETEKDYPQVFKLVEEAFLDMKEATIANSFWWSGFGIPPHLFRNFLWWPTGTAAWSATA